MQYNLLEKYDVLNAFSKEKANEFVNAELDKLFAVNRTRNYEYVDDYSLFNINNTYQQGILSVSYNALIQSTQATYNKHAQELQCGPQEFAGAIYMKLIHEIQEIGYKTIAVGNFGFIVLKESGFPIVCADNEAPYDYQPDQNNHVYGIKMKDHNDGNIIVTFIDYRLANHIAGFTDSDVFSIDLNTLPYPYFCREGKAQLCSPITKMSIHGNLIGYIIDDGVMSKFSDYLEYLVHDYDKEIITENQKVVCTYYDEDYTDFYCYDFKIEDFAQKATSPEAVEEILKDIREQISNDNVKFCHVEPIMMAVDDNVSYFRMLTWATAPNRQRYLPPVLVEEMLDYPAWAGETSFLPVVELARYLDANESIGEYQLASDMLDHLESIHEFITPGYLACEINHFLKLSEKENWLDKTYVPYVVNGITFALNYMDAKENKITKINDVIYEGLILKPSEGKALSELGEEYITLVKDSEVNSVLVEDNAEDTYFKTCLIFKGKKTYQEVMEGYAKLFDKVSVVTDSHDHPAMVNGNPMFLLTYVKVDHFGKESKYWDSEYEEAYYVPSEYSAIHNMVKYETRIDPVK